MRPIHLIMTALLLMVMPEVYGKSYYNTVDNNFGGLFPNPGMRMQGRYKAIEENCLIDENASLATAMTLDTMHVNATTYRYQLRLANLNNKQGKTRTMKDPMTGQKTTLTSTQWGLVFNADGQGNYCAVVLSCDNSSPYNDITDQRTMQVKLIECDGKQERQLGEATLCKGISLEDEMNTLSVDLDDERVIVFIGKDEPERLFEATVSRPAAAVRVGFMVGPGARVAVERAVLTIDNDQQTRPTTLWTRETLDEHFANSADPVEGYWKYLDRDMEDKWLRLGGRYTLAVVRSDNGYDLIYIDGAQVKKSQWQTGMLKGHMTRTMFSGNYDATWIDATMEPIDNDVQATVENGVIITMNFPVYKSQVRFAKVLNPDD